MHRSFGRLRRVPTRTGTAQQSWWGRQGKNVGACWVRDGFASQPCPSTRRRTRWPGICTETCTETDHFVRQSFRVRLKRRAVLYARQGLGRCLTESPVFLGGMV